MISFIRNVFFKKIFHLKYKIMDRINDNEIVIKGKFNFSNQHLKLYFEMKIFFTIVTINAIY